MTGIRSAARLNLALQGGGAHGAFTWGVLDRLLQERWVEIDTISATSAGAINAVALLHGLAEGGAEGARAVLHTMWGAIVQAAFPDLTRLNPLLASLGNLEAFTGPALAKMAGMVSPYTFNPLDFNPLRKLLGELIDFERIRTQSKVKVLIAATDASTGRARLFTLKELSLDVVLASACLPMLHKAIKIGDVHYWDGGFSANPDLITLARSSKARDTLVVLLNPTVRARHPTHAVDILDQINRITFSQPLLRDVREIAALREALRGPGAVLLDRPSQRIARHRFHLIEAGAYTSVLPETSKMRPERPVVDLLFQAGVRETEGWIARSARDVGRRETADLALRLLHGEGADSRHA